MVKLLQFSKSKKDKPKRWQDDLPPLPTKVVKAYDENLSFNELAQNIRNQQKALGICI